MALLYSPLSDNSPNRFTSIRNSCPWHDPEIIIETRGVAIRAYKYKFQPLIWKDRFQMQIEFAQHWSELPTRGAKVGTKI